MLVENDDNIHALIELCLKEPFVALYVEHIDNENWIEMSDAIL